MPSETVKKAKKSAAKTLADKKLAQTIVKDTHMGGFVNFIRSWRYGEKVGDGIY